MRRWFATSGVGALIGVVLTMLAEASQQWRDWGCAAPAPAPPCVRPAFWHWSDVDPVIVVVGGVAFGLIALGLSVLAGRQRRKRQSWGED